MPVELCCATIEDLELMLSWRSNPRIYEHFHDQDDPLAWEDHVRWFVERPPKRRDLIISYQGRRVGVVAINPDGEVSIYVGEETLWGTGVATEALTEACERYQDRGLYALVHKENTASMALFTKCGFEHVDDDDGWVSLQYRPGEES